MSKVNPTAVKFTPLAKGKKKKFGKLTKLPRYFVEKSAPLPLAKGKKLSPRVGKSSGSREEKKLRKKSSPRRKIPRPKAGEEGGRQSGTNDAASS